MSAEQTGHGEETATDERTGSTNPGGAGEATLPEKRPGRGRWPRAVLAGLAGAVTVTLLNEGVRRRLPHAPRMEVIGERALAGSLDAVGVTPPRGQALYRWTLLGDLVSNTAYYALVGVGSPGGTWARGGALGLAAGLGAVFLPRRVGLGRQPGEQAPRTPVLTAAWYLAGGLAAAATAHLLTGREEPGTRRPDQS